METKRKVLWFDDNLAFIAPYVRVLQRKGYDVEVVADLTGAEELVTTKAFDLLILDVMIPTWNEEEEKRYPPAETERGYLTGVLFFRFMKDALNRNGTNVLVVTSRLDEDVLEAFRDEGLPEHCFARRIDLRDVEVFLDKVSEVLGGGA